MVKKKWMWLVIVVTLVIGLGGGWWLNNLSVNEDKAEKVSVQQGQEIGQSEGSELENVEDDSPLIDSYSPVEESDYVVTRVIDGDTIDVKIGGVTQRVRLIGIDTPESVDPRQGVECFGKEASVKLKDLIEGEVVSLEADASQSNKDKYGRLLRYVFDNEININELMVREGYAFEYTYQDAYRYQAQFKEAERMARENQKGLWSSTACNGERKIKGAEVMRSSDTEETKKEEAKPAGCAIKGNINTKDEKIYHLPGCGSYEKTQIDNARGERWFCSETEAVSAGWRKAGNCN